MPAQAERAGRGLNRITEGSMTHYVNAPSFLKRRATEIGIAGLSLATVATLTLLVLKGMPQQSEQTRPVSPTMEPDPTGQSLPPFLAALGSYQKSLYETNPLIGIEWIDCSRVPLRGYAEASVGSKRLEIPLIGTKKELRPSLPKGEPFTTSDLLRMRTQVSETLWAMNPQTNPGRLPETKGQALYVLVKEVTGGNVTTGANLVGSLESCEVKPIKLAK